MAKEKGKATGLVTTSGITDATPAAFVAHVKKVRRGEDCRAIGQLECQYPFRGPKSLLPPRS